MKRLWIITELFYPEETATAYILTKIANHLAGSLDVNVVCGPAAYEGGNRQGSSEGLDKRVNVHRVSDTKLSKNGLLTRVLRFVSLTWKLTKALKKSINEGDEILVVTNPAPILLSAALLKRKRGNKLHLLVHDVFPENTIPAGIIKSSNSLFYRVLKSRFDKAYAAADTLIVLGRDMQDVVSRKVKSQGGEGNVSIIENWADIEGVKMQFRQNEGKIELQYAGNIGRVQGLVEFLQCVKMASNNSLHVSFYGDGAVKPDLIDYVDKNQMNNFSFWGSYKRDEQNKILNSCDLAIITLAKGMYGLGVPSKTYNILAAGKPIMFIGDVNSEVALMVKEHGIGYVFPPENQQEIKDFLAGLSLEHRPVLQEMGLKARNLAEISYSESAMLDKYSKLFV